MPCVGSSEPAAPPPLRQGFASRLYRALVRDKKIASFSEGLTGYPGVKYPHLFAFLAVPLPGHTPQEMADYIKRETAKWAKLIADRHITVD